MLKRIAIIMLAILVLSASPALSHGEFVKEVKKLHYQQTGVKMSDTTAHAINEAIINYGTQYNIDLFRIMGIIEVETNFTSVKGDKKLKHPACGLMQVQPRTANLVLDQEVTCEELIRSPKLNIKAGVKYLARKKEQFHGYVSAALSAYNGGNIDYICLVNNTEERIINMHYDLKH